jgi:hypothetical protein
MQYLPLARRRGIVVQDIGDEVLVYDLDSHNTFCLNETSGAVYMACDGFTSFEELRRRKRGFTDDLINLALVQLDEQGLLEKRDESLAPLAGMSRRDAVRKVAMASALALPLIMSVAAPTALHAASVCGLPCSGPGTCTGTCPTCTGTGICSAGATPCANLGGACSGFGTCFSGVCIPGGGVCAGPDGTPCSSPGICTGTGTCI